MKKLLLSSLIITAGINMSAMVYVPVPAVNTIQALYTPANGPLILGDRINQQTRILERGTIMYTIFTNPLFANELATIARFDGNPINNLSSYQQIMENLAKTTNTAQAIEVTKAFERTIMYLYDYRAYTYGNYKPWNSIAVTGIKWTWVNPLAYFNPKNYVSDNNPELTQLIDELDNLTQIVKKHSAKEGIRLELTVHSYRYWRAYAAATTVACVATAWYYKQNILNAKNNLTAAVAGMALTCRTAGTNAKEAIASKVNTVATTCQTATTNTKEAIAARVNAITTHCSNARDYVKGIFTTAGQTAGTNVEIIALPQEVVAIPVHTAEAVANECIGAYVKGTAEIIK
ncbi:MAG TPA: hypothetical protein VLG50_08680 [Candidatus Saccharimonadales bacterium]|nr:hypothetical protein [Candidatus Saccharimonadales bacterium]